MLLCVLVSAMPQGWVRGGTKEDVKVNRHQRELLTNQEREIAHLKAQLDKMQVALRVKSCLCKADEGCMVKLAFCIHFCFPGLTQEQPLH